jgi:hypothetical protein
MGDRQVAELPTDEKWKISRFAVIISPLFRRCAMNRRRLVFLLLVCLLAPVVLAACGEGDGDDCNDCPPDDDDNDDADDDTSPADDDDDTALPEPPTLGQVRAVVPSAGLPPEAVLQNANNNLDVVRHDGRVFLAFRTAPTHFASEQTELHVISSADELTWDHETSIQLGTDLREPRLLSFDGRLFLYFALLGANPLNFEPGGMMLTEYLGPGDWSEPESFYGEGFIPWRTKIVDGVPYMIAYVGGESIYSVDPEPIEVHFLTTANGREWTPVVPGQPAVLIGGSSETDFVIQDDGSLIAVSRCEAGDPLGFGMKICRAEAGAWGAWQCVIDPKKYDSPYVFRHGQDIYLIGRRNLTPDGNYDLGYDDLPELTQYLIYELDYWIAPKRTALWRIDPDTLAVSFVLDFPSRGDTSFAGVIAGQAGEYIVYNYTSPLGGPDFVWLLGQLNPTHIVRVPLTFATR